MIGRGIIIALMGFIAFLAIDMDELITIIIWFLAANGDWSNVHDAAVLHKAITSLNRVKRSSRKCKEI